MAQQAVPDAGELIARVDVQAAARAIAGVALGTPTLASDELSELAGTRVLLKPECLQLTGSFKLRGALAKVAALGDGAAHGLLTASAGNHARALAQAARSRGLKCEVYMPRDAPVSKAAAVERLGARVHLEGESVDEALELAGARAKRCGAALVHPFDDLDVIAGQATIGSELLDEVDDLARIVVPVGGGGLASGIGAALRQARAEVELVGVHASAAPHTIADGIAVKHPGRLTEPLLAEMLDARASVSEDEIADAMVFLAERAKLVAEGAGAVAVAALMSGRLEEVAGATIAIVSGGNVDSGLLAELLRRHETAEGRRVRLFTRVPDRPGALAELLLLVASARANLVNLEHVREAVPLQVQETGVELTLQTRGPEHTRDVVAALERGGYSVRLE